MRRCEVASRETRSVTRRQVIKAAGTVAGAAAVTAAIPRTLQSAASSTGGVMWTDGFVRPPGSPVNGDQLQQKRVTAVIFPNGTGYGVDTDNAYHGKQNDETDPTATEFAITSAKAGDGGMSVTGSVLRANDPGVVGKAVTLNISFGGPVGTCKYTNGDFNGEGWGVLLS
jgi:hypothetical protein